MNKNIRIYCASVLLTLTVFFPQAFAQTAEAESASFGKFLNTFDTYGELLSYLQTNQFVSAGDRKEIEDHLAKFKIESTTKLVKPKAISKGLQWGEYTMVETGNEQLTTGGGRILKLSNKSASLVYLQFFEALELKGSHAFHLSEILLPQAQAQPIFENTEQFLKRRAQTSSGLGSMAAYAIKSTAGTLLSKAYEGLYTGAGATVRLALTPFRSSVWKVTCDKHGHYVAANPPDLKSLSELHKAHDGRKVPDHQYSSDLAVNNALDAASHYFTSSFTFTPEEVSLNSSVLKSYFKTSTIPGCNERNADKITALVKKEIGEHEVRVSRSLASAIGYTKSATNEPSGIHK